MMALRLGQQPGAAGYRALRGGRQRTGVFTYIDALMFRPESGEAYKRFERLRREVAALDEPFLCGLDAATLPQELTALGFDLVDHLSDTAAVARYDPQGCNGLRTFRHSRTARVRVR